MPTTEMLEAMGKFNEELVNAGVMLAGDGLRPSREGKRVAFDGAEPHGDRRPVRRDPRARRRLWVWEVRDMAEAVEWVKRCPNPMFGPSEIEIRPFYQLADFGEALTPELTELHQRSRDKIGEPLKPSTPLAGAPVVA